VAVKTIGIRKKVELVVSKVITKVKGKVAVVFTDTVVGRAGAVVVVAWR
jgi:hypothetical protein